MSYDSNDFCKQLSCMQCAVFACKLDIICSHKPLQGPADEEHVSVDMYYYWYDHNYEWNVYKSLKFIRNSNDFLSQN